MEDERYFVSVFLHGKNLKMFFSERLQELAIIKNKYNSCEIEILDLIAFRRLSDAEILIAIRKSYEDFRLTLKRKDNGSVKNTDRKEEP